MISLFGQDWFFEIPAGTDMTPLMAGMPDDLCQCPHWGYILKGRLRIRKKDGEQIVTAGEIFYAEPGHVPFFEEDTTMVEFSPKEQWAAMTAMLAKNLSRLPKKD